MNDAIFRAHVESPTSTDIGVGVARDDASGRLFVTITYAAFPPRIDAPMVARCIGDAIEATRGARVDLDLSYVAQGYAERLASGAEPPDLGAEIQSWLLSVTHSRYSKISYSIAKVVDVVEIDPRELVNGRPVRDVGVGVAQTPRYDTQNSGVTWVVALLAEGGARRWQVDVAPQDAARRVCLAAASGRSLDASRR